MIDESSQHLTVTDFGGAQLLPDPALVPLGGALIARNVEYVAKQVVKRTGFATASALFSALAVSAMYNWISSLGNKLITFRTGDRKVYLNDITTPAAATTLINVDLVGYATTHAPAGARLYTAAFLTTGRGAISGYVSSFQSAAFVSDTLFPGPLTYTPSAPTEPGAGFITAGVHRIGYRIEYRSGFVGRPCPDTGTGSPPNVQSFVPIEKTAAGSKNLSITLNTTWPAGAVAVWIIMTPTDNLNRYIMVPGSRTAVVGGSTSSVTIVWSVSDDDLLQNPNINEVSNSLNFWTQTTGGTAPFLPFVVFTHGNRMVYITTVLDNVGNAVSTAVASNIGKYEEISADQHIIQLPGQLDIYCGCSMNGALFLMGPGWTYYTEDSGDVPVTWPTPKKVDGQIGTSCPRGVGVSASGTYAWVVDVSGLYFFDGAYGDLPISYLQKSDWDRINWNYGHTIQVKDFTDRQQVWVMAPLDSATTPSHFLVWDYTTGKDFKTAGRHYSLNTIGGSVAPGAMEMVQNTLPSLPAAVFKAVELWVGQSSANQIQRMLSTADTTPYRDNAGAIDGQYRTAFFRPDTEQHEVQHQGLHARIRGSGTLTARAYTIDYAFDSGALAVTMSATPGPDTFLPISLISEGVAWDFSNNVADGYFKISYLRGYFDPWSMQ